MNKICDKYLTRFLNDFKTEHDTATATILSLSAYKNTLGRLTPGREDIPALLEEMTLVIRQSRPGLIPLNRLLDFFELDMAAMVYPGMPPKKAVQTALQRLEARICQFERNLTGIIDQGSRQTGRTVLVYKPGPYTCRILAAAHDRGRTIRVMAADRQRKTRQMMKKLAARGIEILETGMDQISGSDAALILGPMAVTADSQILAPYGTARVIRQYRERGMTVSFFTDTLHFAGSTPACTAPTGHEQVSLDMADQIITEIGRVSAAGDLLERPVRDFREREETEDSNVGHGAPLPEMALA